MLKQVDRLQKDIAKRKSVYRRYIKNQSSIAVMAIKPPAGRFTPYRTTGIKQQSSVHSLLLAIADLNRKIIKKKPHEKAKHFYHYRIPSFAFTINIHLRNISLI